MFRLDGVTVVLSIMLIVIGVACLPAIGFITVVGVGSGVIPGVAVVIGLLMFFTGGAAHGAQDEIQNADAAGDTARSVGCAGVYILITGVFAFVALFLLLGTMAVGQ